jgi:hypothetical protein
MASVEDRLYMVQRDWEITGFAIDRDGSPIYPNPHSLGLDLSTAEGKVDVENVDGEALAAWTSGPWDSTVVRCALQTLTDYTRPTRPIITVGAGRDPAVAATETAGLVIWVRPTGDIAGALLSQSSWPSVPVASSIAVGPGIDHPDLAYALEAGLFLAVWERGSQGVEGRLLDPLGNPAGPVFTIAMAATAPAVTWDGAHFIVVVHSAAGAVEAVRVAPDGTRPDGAPIMIASSPARFARAGSRLGETLVAWITGGEFDLTYQLRASRLDAEGLVLDPQGVLLHEAPWTRRWSPGPENQVTTVVWSGIGYEVMWIENQPSCRGDIEENDILVARLIPGEPPQTGPTRFAFGSHGQGGLTVAPLGESFWTAWLASRRHGEIGLGARWTLEQCGVTLLDPEGIHLASAENCFPISESIGWLVVASGMQKVLTATVYCNYSYGYDCVVSYLITDPDGDHLAAGSSDPFPNMQWPVVASDGEQFLVAFVAEPRYKPRGLRWMGIDGSGMSLGDLTTGDHPTSRAFDASSNGDGYLAAWASNGGEVDVVFGHFDDQFRLIEEHAVVAPGKHLQGLRLASDGLRYMAVVAGGDSLSAMLLSEDGAVLDVVGFPHTPWPMFDVEWDGFDYVLASIEGDLDDSVVRIRRFTADGDLRDSQPVEVYRLPEPLRGCSVARVGDGLSLIAMSRANLTAHGILYRSGPVPVDLESFDAIAVPGSVTLRWNTGWEVNALGFHVLRAIAPDRKDAVCMTSTLIPAGQQAYEFVDQVTAGTYWYWLEEIKRSGGQTWYGPRVATVEAPRPFLARSSPNPFRDTTEIEFVLPVPGRVTLGIYSVRGHLVRSLSGAEMLSSGTHRVVWDGRDDRGRAVAAGVYLCRFQFGDTGMERKLHLIR